PIDPFAGHMKYVTRSNLPKGVIVIKCLLVSTLIFLTINTRADSLGPSLKDVKHDLKRRIGIHELYVGTLADAISLLEHVEKPEDLHRVNLYICMKAGKASESASVVGSALIRWGRHEKSPENALVVADELVARLSSTSFRFELYCYQEGFYLDANKLKGS